MSDALLNQGWDNDQPTPIFWETVRAILFPEPERTPGNILFPDPREHPRPRDENGRFTKS